MGGGDYAAARLAGSHSGDHAPVVAGIAGWSTAECVAPARPAQNLDRDGLMVLPPYALRGEWRESTAHFEAVITARPLSCMLYYHPIANGTDVSPTKMRELTVHENLHAVKESSGDVRRIAAIREVNGDRLVMFAGMADTVSLIRDCLSRRPSLARSSSEHVETAVAS